ncbi:hypothetical protein [Neisseria sp.]
METADFIAKQNRKATAPKVYPHDTGSETKGRLKTVCSSDGL